MRFVLGLLIVGGLTQAVFSQQHSFDDTRMLQIRRLVIYTEDDFELFKEIKKEVDKWKRFEVIPASAEWNPKTDAVLVAVQGRGVVGTRGYSSSSERATASGTYRGNTDGSTTRGTVDMYGTSHRSEHQSVWPVSERGCIIGLYAKDSGGNWQPLWSAMKSGDRQGSGLLGNMLSGNAVKKGLKELRKALEAIDRDRNQ